MALGILSRLKEGLSRSTQKISESITAVFKKRRLDDQDYAKVLALRERMNRGGKRRYRMYGILRDYTPSPQA